MLTAWRAPGGIQTARDGGTMVVVSSPLVWFGAASATVTCNRPLAQYAS